MDLKLPVSLEVKDTENQGKGIFTKNDSKVIHCGEKVLTNKPYAFEITALSSDDLLLLCHHCLEEVKVGTSMICKKCRVIGYCNYECLKSALPLHSKECKGIVELERLRPKDMGPLHYPPRFILMTARAINNKILRNDVRDDAWLHFLARHDLPSDRAEFFRNSRFREHVRLLVPQSIRDDEIYQMYLVVSRNSTSFVRSPLVSSKVRATTVYFEYSLVNHMCRPTCEFQNDKSSAVLYALQDIQPGSQINMSYLLDQYTTISVREIRRKALKDKFRFDCNCEVCLKEEVVGSECWLLDQKKRSLIAPWSRKVADDVMEKGWKIICDATSMESRQAINLLESGLEAQTLVLDRSNVILIVTVWKLLMNYFRLEECKKAIGYLRFLGASGMNALCEYGTIKEMLEVGYYVAFCCIKLGLIKESSKLFDLLLSVYPKIPAEISYTVLPSAMFAKEMLATKNVNARDKTGMQTLTSYILKLCDNIRKS